MVFGKSSSHDFDRKIMKKVYRLFDCDIFIAGGFNPDDAFALYIQDKSIDAIFILTDSNTRKRCLPLLQLAYPALNNAHILEIRSGESSKSQVSCEEIISTLLSKHAGRNSLLINLGGGVVCDLGGFVAGIYKRGIHFINIPSSLMAMADAAIGGKTAINFGVVKNVIGLFNMPGAVFIFTNLLQTLDSRQFNSGLAEIVKMAILFGGNNLAIFKKMLPPSQFPLSNMIEEAVQQKCRLVASDYRDRGVRKILNFGHTIGHALELINAHETDQLLHGEAIVQGMLFAIALSHKKAGLINSTKELIEKILYFYFFDSNFKKPLFSTVYSILKNDKKNELNTIQFVLLNDIAKPAVLYQCEYQELESIWQSFSKS